jgi:hypothetical protein
MPKAPKALRDILQRSKPFEPLPPEIVPIPDKPVAIEAGSAQGVLLSATNSGPIKQISLASPFGRPPLEPGQAAPVPATPLLSQEEDFPASKTAKLWAEIAQEMPGESELEEADAELEAQLEAEGIHDAGPEVIHAPDPGLVRKTEVASFMPEESEFTVTAKGVASIGAASIDQSSPTEREAKLIQELDELRKEKRAIQEKYNVATNKDGLELALAAVSAERIEKECVQIRLEDANRQIKKLQEKGGVKLPEWKGRDVRVAFPCYKTTNPATAMALVALSLDFGKDRIGFLPGLGDARIANSRNRLADQFLKTEATWCLWLDDDMIPTVGRPQFTRDFIGASPEEVPDKVLQVHVLERLMAAGKHLVGATYFGRRKYSPAMFKEGIDNPIAYEKAQKVTGEVIPCEWVATGCMLVHREVFIGIQRACPELGPQDKRTYWDFFQEGEGESGGEDVMFCMRAKKAGYQAYVDTGAQCFHVGFCAYGFHNTENRMIRPIGATNMETKWW